jgi:hypothetical protein
MSISYKNELADCIDYEINPKLHEIMDKDVGDVYAENDRFTSLLTGYYKGHTENLKEIYLIVFRCASNILKKRFGFCHSWQWIATKAIDITEIILNRITNGLRNNGKEYIILNLPKTVEYAMLNVIYNNPKRLSKEYPVDDIILNLEIEKQSEPSNWEDIICVCIDNDLNIEEYL